MTGAPAVAGGPVVAHSLSHALTAAASAVDASSPLDLVSAPGCGSAAGTGWFAAVGDLVAERFPDLPLTLTLDCADAAGLALGALRRGIKSIIFTGNAVAAARLEDIAAQYGATIHRDRPVALDLLATRNPRTACAGWFSLGGGAPLD